MSNAADLFRSLIVYTLCIPLAVFLGYCLANGFDPTTMIVLGIVAAIMMIPLFLRWHHPWLILTWNMNAVLFFLPGRPRIGLLMCLISLGISIVHYIVDRRRKFISVPALTRPLLFLTLVVIITARLTGGIGLRVLGGETYGGKKYIELFSAIIGYFALVTNRIPPQRAALYVGLFFLGAVTAGVGNLAPLVNPAFYFMFLPFPVDPAAIQMINTQVSVFDSRLGGLSIASSAVFCFMLAHYGVRDIFNLNKWWRLPLLLLVVAITLMGGFRGLIIIFILLFCILFYMEGLAKTQLLPALIISMIVGFAALIPLTNHLPITMQRALSFLPLDVDPIAREGARTSTEWRINMWKHLLPQIPQYLLLGKGYAIDANELNMLSSGMTQDSSGTEGAELAGDYHNGPLSVVIPFGIYGLVGFIWLIAAGFRVLYRNYKFGDPLYKKANTFLYAYFIARMLAFIFLFGSLYSELALFTGLIGLSISLNNGVAQPAMVTRAKVVFNRFRLHPGARRPIGAQ
jgi:hypothetical protein